MKSLALGFLAAMVGATSVAAQAVVPIDPDRVDEFIDVIAKNECRMTNAASELMLPAAGFGDKEEVRAIMSRLLFYGRARADGTALEVFYDPCPDYEGTELKELFLQTLSANGCQMTALESVAKLNEVGINDGEISTMLPMLLQHELVTLSDDEKTIFMTDELCNEYSAEPEQVEDLVAPSDYLLAALRENDCVLHVNAATKYMEDYGFSRAETKEIARGMIEDGQATAEGALMGLKPEACDPPPPDPIAEPRLALIAYLEQNGCEITYQNAQQKLPEAGFDFDQLDKLVMDYVDEGIMEVDADETLRLLSGECRP